MDKPRIVAKLKTLIGELSTIVLEIEYKEGATPKESPIATEKPIGSPKKVVRPKKRTYDDDPSSPSYDPPPPFQVDKVPPRPEVVKPGQLLIKEGTVITCSQCGKKAVRAIRNIYAVDNEEQGLTPQALEVIDPNYDWSEEIEVDKKGGVKVTCPLCGHLALWLVGSPNKNEQTKSV